MSIELTEKMEALETRMEQILKLVEKGAEIQFPERKWLSIPELEKVSHITRYVIEKDIKAGRLSATKRGSSWFIPMEQAHEYALL